MSSVAESTVTQALAHLQKAERERVATAKPKEILSHSQDTGEEKEGNNRIRTFASHVCVWVKNKLHQRK